MVWCEQMRAGCHVGLADGDGGGLDGQRAESDGVLGMQDGIGKDGGGGGGGDDDDGGDGGGSCGDDGDDDGGGGSGELVTLKKRKNKKKFLTLDAPHDVQLKGCDVNLKRKTGQ